MKVKIISDSTCDLSKEQIEKYDIEILPLYVCLNDKTMKDGFEVNPEDIYSYVDESGKLPSTSAANLGDYLDAFKPWVEQGYEVVHFSLSAEFSSSHRNACMAAEELGHCYIVDSRNLSTGQGLVVLHGAEMAQNGATAEEIYKACNEMTSRVEASFIVDKLDYLYKGGRCSALSAFGANLLSLKPCIEVIDGKMKPTKKYRGSFGRVLTSYVADKLKGRDDIDKKRIFVTHTKCDKEIVDDVINAVKEIMPDFEEVVETTAGCTITTHCGPNTLGILYVRK